MPPPQRVPVPSRDYSRVPSPMVSTPQARPPPSVDALLRDHAHMTSRLGIQGLAKRWAPSLVNFVAAVAYHFGLALSVAFRYNKLLD